MRCRFATVLITPFVMCTTVAAQRASIVLVPEITFSAAHEIYRDLIYARIPIGSANFENGWIELEPGTRYGVRAEVLPGSSRWGLFVSYGARDAEMRSGGGDSLASFRNVQDTRTHVFTLGAVRQFSLGGRTGRVPPPDLRVGLAAMVMRIRSEPPAGYGVLPLGPVIRDFFSPGGQLSLGVVQQIGGAFDLRVQGGYAMVRHDTELLDGGGRPGDLGDERDGHWASALDVSLGMGVRF